jgi:hypothetical protein
LLLFLVDKFKEIDDRSHRGRDRIVSRFTIACTISGTRLTAVSNKLYQLFVHGRWFSPGTPASTTKTGRHDIAEILLKVALKHQNINQSINLLTRKISLIKKGGII